MRGASGLLYHILSKSASNPHGKESLFQCIYYFLPPIDIENQI